MATAEESLMDWLRDAYAMEQQAETMLHGQSQRLEHYPALQRQIEKHLQETRQQAELLKRCIEARGGSTSAIKDMAGKMAAVGQAIGGMFVGDEVVKGSTANYTFEHMEIAAYRVLIAAAEQVGDTETRSVCEQILRQEEAMANWLAEHLPSTTQQYLSREEAGSSTAKR